MEEQDSKKRPADAAWSADAEEETQDKHTTSQKRSREQAAAADAGDDVEAFGPAPLPEHGWKAGMFFEPFHKHFRFEWCQLSRRERCSFMHQAFSSHPGDPMSSHMRLTQSETAHLVVNFHEVVQVWAGWEHKRTSWSENAWIAAQYRLRDGSLAWTNLARLSRTTKTWIPWALETDSSGMLVHDPPGYW